MDSRLDAMRELTHGEQPKSILIATAALGDLLTVLRSRVMVSTVNRGGSKG